MNRFFGKAGRPVASLVIASSLLLASCEKDAFVKEEALSQASDARLLEAHDHVPNELLVKFKAGAALSARSNALARVSGRMKEKIATKAMERAGDKEGITVIHTPLGVGEALGRLKGLGEVEFAEPNYIYTHCATSNDPYYTNGNLWGMYGSATTPKNDFGSQAGTAWANNKVGSDNVYIGIIDEGVMHTHEDLAPNWGRNLGEIAGNGIDDDRNGYIDDVYGWDFDGNNNTIYDGTQDDHGTHVAGTIGAKGGNGKGVAGVVWNVKMLNAKFLGRNGGTTANAIKAVDYFTNLKTRASNPLNIVATNNSWGGGGFSQGLYDAIQRANTAGILFIAAAGNGGSDGVGDNNETTPHYPSSYTNSNIIAVASITSAGTRSGFSNYGATSVDIGAPGSSILSTLPGKNNKPAYGSYSGTSMATPHVTGAAALYKAAYPAASAAAIKDAILSRATATSSLSGRTVTGGRLNVSGF